MDRYELRRVDYSLTDDHTALRDAYKQFFATHCPIDTVRAAEASGFDHIVVNDEVNRAAEEIARILQGHVGTPPRAP